MNATPAPYRFHAFEVSYFSAKVRPALRYKQLWYEEVRANVGDILQRTGLGFIPILETPDGQVWQDTSEILDQLEVCHPNPPLFPTSPVQRMAAHLIELYSDEFGLIPAMHYRWGSELGEASARARFTAMIGNEKRGRAAADRMARARLMLGATDAAAPAIEAHTRDLLDVLSRHFGSSPYLLGARMSLADCALMGPLYGHFFNDLVSRKLLLESAVPVCGWIERCNFPTSDGQGEWLEGDALAPSLRAVLSVMGRDAAQVLLDAVRSFEAWADTRPEDVEEPPRAIGPYATALRGTPIQKGCLPYSLWMLQRSLDVYRSFSEPERKRVDESLVGSGWETVLAYQPRHRLGKKNFQLIFEKGDS